MTTPPATPASPLHKALSDSLPQGGEVELQRTGPDTYAFHSLRLGITTVFSLDAALPFLLPALAKADTPIPDGARWITVHPNGEGSKGTAVLVQEEKKGAGVWHVIAGAGGSLNYLKVRGVKSEGEYRKEAAEKTRAKRAEKKAQQAKDKETGLSSDKKLARDNLRAQVRAAEQEFSQHVAKVQGRSNANRGKKAPAPLSRATPVGFDKARDKALLKCAPAAVGLLRPQALLLDPGAGCGGRLGWALTGTPPPSRSSISAVHRS